MKHGRKWRLKTDGPPDDGLNLANIGTFDEVVVDRWLHVERMNAHAWWLQVGDAWIWVNLSEEGEASVSIRRGEYGPEIEPSDEYLVTRVKELEAEIEKLKAEAAEELNLFDGYRNRAVAQLKELAAAVLRFDDICEGKSEANLGIAKTHMLRLASDAIYPKEEVQAHLIEQLKKDRNYYAERIMQLEKALEEAKAVKP